MAEATLKVHMMKHSDIVVLPNRGRKKFEGIKELAESMKKHGLITALCVNRGNNSLIAGERRLRAIRMLPMLFEQHELANLPPNHAVRDLLNGLVPVVYRDDLPEDQLKEIELEENIFRENLEWPEKLALEAQIHEARLKLYGPKSKENPTGWTLEQTAATVGEAKSTVSQNITFHKKLEEYKKIDPNIVDRLRQMPLSAAVKELDRIEVATETERKAAAGLITLSNQIIHGDCITELRKFSSDFFNCSIADMPFGIPELAESAGESKSGGSTTYTARLLPDDNLDAQGAAELARAWAPELFRVLKPSAHAWTFFSWEIFDAVKSAFRNAGFVICEVPIIWNKGRMTSPFKGYDPAPMYEPILLAHKPPRSRRLSEPVGMVFSYSPVPETAKKIHPFEKPPELLTKLIKLSTNQGETIIDSFAGSFSTGRVAKELGRGCVGIEKSKERYLQAQNALLAETLK
jgi:site-specific DNA-methyltransferase (adenine-specific)